MPPSPRFRSAGTADPTRNSPLASRLSPPSPLRLFAAILICRQETQDAQALLVPVSQFPDSPVFQFSASATHLRLVIRAQRGHRSGVNLLDRITIKPGRRNGKPCIRETRITVYDVLGYLAAGTPESELLAEFPALTHEDILACFAFAAERDRRTFSPRAA